MRVSFVGTGQIGTPMADRLLGAGHDLTVYARRAEVRERFAEKGAHVTDSLADAAQAAEVVHVAVYSDDQFAEVSLADDGILANLADDALLVSHTTGSPATIRRIAEAGSGHVVDAPFSGAAPDIEAGHLTVMLGGAPGDVARARETIAAFGDPIVEIGALGSALVVKLLNNALLAANMQLAVQADALANELGIETATFAPVILASSGASYAMGVLSSIGSASKMIELAGHYLYKDAEVVQQVLGELGVDLGIIGEVIERGPAEFKPR
jgi:3-hydroxyisobutyrate dehydrogenase-like beta-hydroxyacid dehydrogenase